MATAKQKKDDMLLLFEELLKLPTTQVHISKVMNQNALNSRVQAHDDDHVEELMYRALDGAKFPPVLLHPRENGTYDLVWGRHRFFMHEKFVNGDDCKPDASYETMDAIVPTDDQIGKILGCKPRPLTDVERLSLASTENDTPLRQDVGGVWMPADSHSPMSQSLEDYVGQITQFLEAGVATKAACKRMLPVCSQTMFDHAYKNAESRLRNKYQRQAQDAIDLYSQTKGKEGMDWDTAHETYFPGWGKKEFRNLMRPGSKKAGANDDKYLEPPDYLETYQGNYKAMMKRLIRTTNQQLSRVMADYTTNNCVTRADAEGVFDFIGKELKRVQREYNKKMKEFEERKNGLVPDSDDEE